MTTLLDTAFYVDSAQYANVAQWATGTPYSVGNVVRQKSTPTQGNERCYVCTVAGTSNATTEPVWTFTRGAVQPTDGTVTWSEATGLAGMNGDTTNIPLWSAFHSAGSATLGALCSNNAGTYLFLCTTSGTPGSSEPSWTLTVGVGTIDNSSVHWMCIGKIGTNFTTKWGAPHARLYPMVNYISQNGTYIYVGDDHAETASTVLSFNPGVNNSVNILCVDHTASLPPGPSNLKTTATITNTSTSNWANFCTTGGQSTNAIYVYGISFINNGTSGSTYLVDCLNNIAVIRFEQCQFQLANATPSSALNIGCTTAGGQQTGFINCIFSIAKSAQFFGFGCSPTKIVGCTFTGSAQATHLFEPSAYGVAPLEFIGCDFSYHNGALFYSATEYFGPITVRDCKINSSTTLWASGTPSNVPSGADFYRVDSGALYYRNERHSQNGDLTTNIAAVRTNGATDGTTPISHKIVTGSVGLATTYLPPYSNRFDAIPYGIWNTVTGTNRNVVIHGVVNDTRIPYDTEVWMEVEYLGNASYTLGTTLSSLPPILTAGASSAISADTSAWDTALTARANTYANVVGDMISVSSAPGQIFFCTTSGTTSSSLPSGYATCADGSSVTDGTAVFQAGCRFKITLVLSATQIQAAGYVFVSPKFGRPTTSFTYFLDPSVSLS